MELRHLRYYVAVAEEGSLTVAAQKRKSGCIRRSPP
jgi:DNA-binding transcriptional LysR family regulator